MGVGDFVVVFGVVAVVSGSGGQLLIVSRTTFQYNVELFFE